MSLAQNSADLARAVHAVLAGDMNIQSKLGSTPRLYDSAPEDPIYPYLTYGPMRATDVSADETHASQHQMTFHVWSRYSGRSEVFGVLDAVSSALSAAAFGTDAPVRAVNTIFADVLRAPDGRTHHGLLRLSFLYQN